MAQIDTATSELARKQAQLKLFENDMYGGLSNADGSGMSERNMQHANLVQEVAGLQDKAAAKNYIDPAAADRKKALDLTEGRGDATMNDPRINAALDMIQKQMASGPYTDQVVNQQANRMADRTATAAGQTAQSLRDQMTARGGNMNDPSFQAALRNADSGRMQQNNANRGDLESNATLQNYSAQNAAANQLANQRMSQLGQANGQYNQAANLYANEQFSGGHVNSYGTQSQPMLNYTPPTYGNTGDVSFTYNGDQQPQPSKNVPLTSNGMPITQPQPQSNGYGKVSNWGDPGVDNTQYDNAGDPTKPLPAGTGTRAVKSPFVYKPTTPYAQY